MVRRKARPYRISSDDNSSGRKARRYGDARYAAYKVESRRGGACPLPYGYSGGRSMVPTILTRWAETRNTQV